MLRDFENVDDVNKQLERLGYNMGVRLIEDFLARTNPGRCLDMKDTAEKVQQAFRWVKINLSDGGNNGFNEIPTLLAECT